MAFFSLCASADVEWTPSGGWRKTQPGPHGREFDRAFELFMEGKTKKAAGLFESVRDGSSEPLREDASILYAESLLASNNYRGAYDAYEKFIEEYPNSRHIDRALQGELEIAVALLTGKKIKALGLRIWSAYGMAEKVVDKIISHRPLSDYARKAQVELARSYFKRRLYIESASAWRQYMELFPNGPEIEEALLGIGRSLLNDAQGPTYDPLPYYKAGSVASNLMRDYPSAAEADATRAVRDTSRENLAEHYFLLAKWYMKMGKADAAVLYLSKVTDNFPESSYADRAAGIMEILAGTGGQ